MNIRRFFTDDIPALIDDYEERPEQIEMAEAVGQALLNSECLIVEAGTGVGKTLAYLIPMAQWAIENKKRVIVSTYSKALQSQIYKKDLPLVKKLFPDLKYDIIFGSSNYMCIRRFKEFDKKGSLFANAGSGASMAEFFREAEGLRENVKFHIPNEVWENVCRVKRLCHEEGCEHFTRCHYWTLRHRLRKANIIVVNHHLFFADLMVNKRLLPESQAVVFDEAHKLEETMRDMFSVSFNSGEYIHLLKEIEDFLAMKKRKTKKDYKTVKSQVKAAGKNFRDFAAAVCSETGLLKDKSVLLERDSRELSAYYDVRHELRGALYELKEYMAGGDDKGKKLFAQLVLDRIERHAAAMEQWLARREKGYFYWLEMDRGQEISLNMTPYDLKKDFEEHVRFNYETVVFTSATLSAAGTFNYVVRQFGLEDAATGLLKSPFDYHNNALLYLEKNLPVPQAADFRDKLADRVTELIKITGGNMFVLFTSIDLMRKTHRTIQERFPSIPMLIQGQAAPMEVVKEFRKRPSVLFGTSTFWQGIDIKGDDLRCVVITRLPFEVPDHPVQKAIYRHVVEEGGNDFEEIALPRAIFMLKQGFGRLIRSKDDYGVVAILDSRITQKSYGKLFVRSLPEAPATSEIRAVEDFFRVRS
ncbi:MAG: ATP-dependent DNA helicase [Spirochaetia bacterium]|nr:ATP-dependent DNA helicase [Spirochaetia bacterium]